MIARFPFLTQQCFTLAVELEVELQVCNEQKPSDPDRMYALHRSITTEVVAAARQQIADLAALAQQSSADARKARRILGLILLAPGGQPEQLRQFLQESAASTIGEAVEAIADDEVAECVSVLATCLTRRMNFSEQIRIDLLKAFMSVARPSEVPGVPTRLTFEAIGAILTETFLLEMSRPVYQQSIEFGAEILHLMCEYKYPSAASILEIVVDSHWSIEIRELAANALVAINESLETRWQMTATDSTINLNMRAARIQEASRGRRPAAELAQMLFESLKDAPVKDSADPRIWMLKKLLVHPEDLVRLSVCWGVMRQHTYSAELDKTLGCIKVLADVAVRMGSLTIAQDARNTIAFIQLEHPDLSEAMAQACRSSIAQAQASNSQVHPQSAPVASMRGAYG
jgi:hypothetical protein